jgi:aminoglycoside phosphotransferase family enzyme
MNDEVESQEDVLAFLGDPATHGGTNSGGSVRRIDTHTASVFLAGNRALKVKRAVRFPFLDYSTLAKRKEACEAELAVNTPHAPEIYRGVIAIAREADGRLTFAGPGAPVEWAVEMRRFDETRTLDHLASEIDEDLADKLGRAVAAAHEKAPIVEAAPWIEALETYLDQNLAAFRAMPDLFAPKAVAALDRLSRAAYARVRLLLAERGRLGRVQRGHGDLHLGNIVLIDDHPVLFDAIEFDPLMAAGDVLYDLAFLLMDLCERGLSQAANIALNRYLIETRRIEDLDGLAALPFFLSLRAAIRAKVTAARTERAPAPQRGRMAASAAGAEIHFRRRPLQQREVAARADASAVRRADAQRGHRALGRRAHDAPWRRRNRKAARSSLCVSGERARLCRRPRQGAPRPFRRTFYDCRCRVCEPARARRLRQSGNIRQCSFAGTVPHRESRDAACPCRRARA